jgi:hypothetical protein
MKKILLLFCTFLLFNFSSSAEDVMGVVKNASMANCADGRIDLTVSGGFAPYTFFWTGPNNFTANSEDIVNLKPGHYIVTVNDVLCGEAIIDFTVGYDDSNIYISDKINIDQCERWETYGKGAISLSVPGQGYTFNWSGPNNFNSTSQNISNLSEPGHYVVTVTNVSGCTKILEEDICCCYISTQNSNWVPPSSYYCASGVVSPNLTIQDPKLFSPSGSNTLDGSIDISVYSGNVQVYYNWSGPNGYSAHTQDISGLNPGQYCVTVSSGCLKTTACYTLVVCSESNLSVSGTINNTCQGFNAGSISITTTGGNPQYSYKWSNGATTSSIDNLSIGQYCVTVTDASGCTRIGCYTVGTKNSITTRTTTPCQVLESCNGQTRGQNYNYQQTLNCNELYSYCPATGQTIVEDLGWASAFQTGCTLFGMGVLG